MKLHQNFKSKIVEIKEGDTVLTLKQLVPVRLIRNKFYQKIEEAEHRGAGVDELKEILGRARAKKGMFEGDLEEGELEIAQIADSIKEIKPAAEILQDIWAEFIEAKEKLSAIKT